MGEIKMEEKKVTRRTFLKGAGLVVGGAIGGGLIGGFITSALTDKAATGGTVTEKPAERELPPSSAQNGKVESDSNRALMFFTREQFELIEAAAERIFPADELGPGAKELGVAFFIDHQLAGPWGVNAGMYMQGPFQQGVPTQGEQSRLTKREIYRMAIQAMEEWTQKKYNKKFTDLSAGEQDEVLDALQKGEVDTFKGYSPSDFFALFRTNVLEGLYSDPVYGGNREMGGWKLKKYPGAQMSYSAHIDKDEIPQIEPVSLRDHIRHS